MSNKLSLGAAILININIMLGSGIFINTVLLAKQTESFSPLVYALVALLILPLILAIVQLLKLHQDGGTFYHFGASMHPYAGFLSSWSYFIAKLAGCALGVHICISLLQEIIPILKAIPTIPFDIGVIALFALLNMLHMQMGGSIQMGFMGLKLVPIVFVFFTGLYLFNPANFLTPAIAWQGIPFSIPLVLYAFTGFEASCSLSKSIINSEKNGPKATLISYALVVAILMLYQTIFYGNLGSLLGILPDFKWAFPTLLAQLIPQNIYAQNMITSLLHIGIASSSLGAAYGIMFSNSWNLYTLAQHGHLNCNSLFLRLNKYAIPYMCIITEMLLAASYLILTQGSQVPLQQVSALGSCISYMVSSISLLYLTYKATQKIQALPVLSIMSCLILLSAFIVGIYSKGISWLLIVFILILAYGSYMFFNSKNLEQ